MTLLGKGSTIAGNDSVGCSAKARLASDIIGISSPISLVPLAGYPLSIHCIVQHISFHHWACE